MPRNAVPILFPHSEYILHVVLVDVKARRKNPQDKIELESLYAHQKLKRSVLA